MERTSCVMTRAPSSTAWTLPCRRRPARRLRLEPAGWRRGDLSDIVIEIRDEHDQRVVTVTASMQIERHDLSSQPLDLGQA